MGIKALIYFEIVTTAALVIGLAVVNFTKPGAGVTLAAANTDVLKTIGQTHPQNLGRNYRARVSCQRYRGHGAWRRFADRRVQCAVRARRFSRWRKGKTNHPRDGQSLADHVQVYKLRDAVCAHRGRRGDGSHGWHARLGRAVEPRQVDRVALSRSRNLHPCRFLDW